jgi:hypothetical protein
MIDRVAVEALVKKQAKEMGDSVSVELHLLNGEVLFLRGGIEYFDVYFVAEIFPSEPLNLDKLDEKIPKNESGQRVFDRLIVPYQAISYIRVSARKPAMSASLGFAG